MDWRLRTQVARRAGGHAGVPAGVRGGRPLRTGRSSQLLVRLGVPAELFDDRRRGSGYEPSLDGLRAVAILAVIGYHVGHLPGGYFGVDVFFVISGYLITRLLRRERERNGSVSLARFYARRALRLLPALFVVVAACVAVAAVVLPAPQAAAVRDSVPSVLTYTANFRAVDPARMPLLAHTWSLSMEEQFYLVWPLPFVWLSRRVAPRRVAAGLLALALASTTWCGILLARGASFARLSDLPDTHATSLLVGCSLALLIPAGTGWRPSPRLARWIRRAAVPAVLLLVLAFRVQLDGGAFPYEGGFLVVALLTAVVVADQASAAPSGVATVLRHPVAVLIGRWSYTLYLVHLPIVQLLSRTDLPATEQLVLDLVLSFAAAAAVSLGIEQPALRLKRRLSASPEPSPPGAAGVGLATAGALPVPVGGTPDLRPAARMSGDGHDGPDPPPAPPSA